MTRGVRVSVRSRYLEEHSNPADDQYFFVYQVTIANDGEAPVKLESRHWIITDANGHVEEVRGPGVVGETPRLEPGQSFEYTSGCPLTTPIGAMRGSYQMVTDAGERFDAAIPEFNLATPFALN